jgi:hypothetical protein
VTTPDSAPDERELGNEIFDELERLRWKISDFYTHRHRRRR